MLRKANIENGLLSSVARMHLLCLKVMSISGTPFRNVSPCISLTLFPPAPRSDEAKRAHLRAEAFMQQHAGKWLLTKLRAEPMQNAQQMKALAAKVVPNEVTPGVVDELMQ